MFPKGRNHRVNRCVCTALYSGLECGHPIFLSWPFLPDVMKDFNAEFEGELVMSQAMNRKELIVSQTLVCLAMLWLVLAW